MLPPLNFICYISYVILSYSKRFVNMKNEFFKSPALDQSGAFRMKHSIHVREIKRLSKCAVIAVNIAQHKAKK